MMRSGEGGAQERGLGHDLLVGAVGGGAGKVVELGAQQAINWLKGPSDPLPPPPQVELPPGVDLDG